MGSTDNEEKVWIRKLKTGDERTFRKIYITYHKQLYTVAIKYLRTKDLADDAVHDVFVKLWDNRDKLDESGSLRGFLFTAIQNHVLNMIASKKRKLKKQLQFFYEKNQGEEIPDNIIIFSEYKKIYQAAVEELPEARRKIFELRINEGLTNEEVAGYLEISIHTVKSQFYKASRFIREFVNKHAHIDTGT